MSKNPAVLLLEHHLKELKLPTFLRDYDSVGAVCSQERCDYPTYLLRLAERELIDRERRATERRIKEAAFPVLKTIETFDFAAQVSINEPLVRELLRGEYIGKRENLLLVGNPGTGKTHLATALGLGASQFLAGSKAVWGKRRDQRSLRQKVSRQSSASSPIVLQNWPGRLNRHCACRPVASTAPLPIGSPARRPAR